jgi:hypothetical protein
MGVGGCIVGVLVANLVYQDPHLGEGLEHVDDVRSAHDELEQWLDEFWEN